MAINDVVRLNVQGTLHGQTVQYGHHFRFKTAGATFSGLAAAYESAVLATLKAATSADVTWNRITVADVRPTGPETFTHPFAAGQVGVITGDGAAAQLSAVVSVHTGQKGRRRRGRFYVPGIAEAGTTGGLIVSAQLTALTALAETIEASFTGAPGHTDYELVVHSPEELTPTVKAPPPARPGTITTAATNLVLDTRVMTQRRRRLGVGI